MWSDFIRSNISTDIWTWSSSFGSFPPPAAVRASAGALLHVPVARVTNLSRSLEHLKDRGFFVVGLDQDAAVSIYEASNPSWPLAVVVGAEDLGLSRLVRECCDLVVASTNASFGVPEVKRSLVAAAGGLFRLPRALPPAVAMELVLTGDPIPAARAHELGMVNQLVEPGQVLPAALALAERISANAPLAVRESLAIVKEALTADDETLWKLTAEAMARLVRTEDFAEGPRAFIEKRPAAWKGR